MAHSNMPREQYGEEMREALEGARVIGYDDSGHIAIWKGGYTINIYDAVTDWSETTAVTSGNLAAVTDYDQPEAYEYAKERMKSEGFDPVE